MSLEEILTTTTAAVLANLTDAAANTGALFEEQLEQPEAWETWFYGFCVVTISAAGPPLGLLLIPLLSKSLYERCMTFLVALGIGSMTGSCLFILLPHAFGVTQVNESEYLEKSWLIVGALYCFFGVDRLLQWILEARRKSRNRTAKIHASTLEGAVEGWRKSSIITRREPVVQTVEHLQDVRIEDGRGHELDHDALSEKERQELEDEIEVSALSNALTRSFSTRKQIAVIRPKPVDQVVYKTANGECYSLDAKSLNSRQSSRCPSPHRSPQLSPQMSPRVQRKTNGHLPHQSPNHTVHYGHPLATVDPAAIPHKQPLADPEMAVSVELQEKRVIDKSRLEVSSVAYMIIFGSSLNNFVDGMSMGAAFSDSIVRGVGIGLAVLSNQFPAELGVLAILVKSGLGIRKTLLLNCIACFLSYVGFSLGVAFDAMDDSFDVYIFSTSSGMYLYITLSNLLPELREQFNELLREGSTAEIILTTILQAVGIGCSLTLMYLMNINSDEI
ncbi:hypothetical protein M3Y99_00932000 [Aphelenchoides fujianensis]|nr:hypothetical protein M3Y99_00932000 [Aphelenchoides fujianensis]